MSERDRLHLTLPIADIKAAASYFLPVPEGGTVKTITGILGLTIIVDCVVTSEIAGTLVTGGGFTFTATGSNPGDKEVATPTAANVIPAGGALEIILDGGPSTGGSVVFEVEIERDV
jgi:hypothetical protein